MPYDLDAAWVPYYAELEPGKRFEILSSLTEDEGEFRHTLYRERYRDPLRPGREVDNWLWKSITLQRLSCPGFFKRAARREVAAILKELRLPFEGLSGDEEAALYWEFRNTARRYLYTCLSEGYGNSFFGLKRAAEKEKRLKACGDIWAMSRGVALAYGLEEDMKPWCGAFRAEMLDFAPECGEQYED